MKDVLADAALEWLIYGARDMKCDSRAHLDRCAGEVTHRYRNSHGRDIPACRDVSKYFDAAVRFRGRCGDCGKPCAECWSVTPI